MQYSTIHEAFKEIIKDKEGFAFHELNKIFWQSVIDASLELSDGNKTKACKMLGITTVTFRAHDHD